MKQYIGTKRVNAEPMTRTEVEKLFDREIKPVNMDYSEEGYLVEYEDGYKSWSPKEIFDKVYKPCEDFMDRLIIERDELIERISKLSFVLGKKDFRIKVGESQYNLMMSQLDYMQKYYNILKERIEDLEILASNGCCKK